MTHGRRRSQRRPAGERHEPSHEFLELEGLGQIVVSAGFEFVDALVDARQIGEEEDRRGDAFRPQERNDRKTVQLRQHSVERDRVEAVCGGELKSLAAVAGDRRFVAAR